MRTLYSSLALGALLLMSLGSYACTRDTRPYQTPRPSSIQQLNIGIGEPNIRLNPPLKIDEECFRRSLDRYLLPNGLLVIVTFLADDDKISGFYITGAEKYEADLIERAKECQIQ